MTVAELISLLQREDPSLLVALPGTGPAEGEFVAALTVETRLAWNEPPYHGHFTPSRETNDSRQAHILVIE